MQEERPLAIGRMDQELADSKATSTIIHFRTSNRKLPSLPVSTELTPSSTTTVKREPLPGATSS